jgi:hypothetical protein
LEGRKEKERKEGREEKRKGGGGGKNDRRGSLPQEAPKPLIEGAPNPAKCVYINNLVSCMGRKTS